jgi:hypothetical protein
MFLTVGQPYLISPRFLERLRKLQGWAVSEVVRVVRFLGDVPDLTSISQGETLRDYVLKRAKPVGWQGLSTPTITRRELKGRIY